MMIKTLQKGARYTSRVVRHFVEQAALKGFDRLPQHSASRSYWHDPTRHALVGLHLGIDLHRYDSRYHVLETNLGAMLRPERRELYDAPLDPNIFLSAHARLGRIELPNRIAGGLVEGLAANPDRRVGSDRHPSFPDHAISAWVGRRLFGTHSTCLASGAADSAKV